MPCYGRPIRTKRAINSIINQTEKSWEALIVGDNCPVIQELIDSKEYNNHYPTESKFVLENLPINYGHCGYAITNMNIKRAVGEYFVFMANDDIILNNHLENYLSEIEGTDYDFVYFDSFTRYDGIRKSKSTFSSRIVFLEHWLLLNRVNNKNKQIVNLKFSIQILPMNAFGRIKIQQ
jgi:glycosyltransferase involved in cell wall biosynthesis